MVPRLQVGCGSETTGLLGKHLSATYGRVFACPLLDNIFLQFLADDTASRSTIFLGNDSSTSAIIIVI